MDGCSTSRREMDYHVIVLALAHRPSMTNLIRRYERYFLRTLHSLMKKYPRHLIINMDETMIRQVQGPKRVWGMKGVGVRRINTRSCVKNGITACISVVANGFHLPTFFIKKGTTPRSLSSLKLHTPEMSHVRCTYTKKGWSTSEAMIDYLYNIIRPYSNDEPYLLIWDVHASHKVDEVIEYARKWDIEILLIPAGTIIHL